LENFAFGGATLCLVILSSIFPVMIGTMVILV